MISPLTIALTMGFVAYLHEHRRMGVIVKPVAKTPAQRRAACEVYKRRAQQ